MEHYETSMICDAMHSLGYKPTILGNKFKENFSGAKFVGKCRTILLKKFEEGDNPEKLHDGLKLLDELNEGDVVVVAKGFENNAYFGELMSILSKRNGAVGAVVDGCTRDKYPTIELKFPVFAKNWYGNDIRDYGIVENYDCPVEIDEIKINPGDLIFADGDGVIVLSKKRVKEVLSKVSEIINQEKKVKTLMESNNNSRELLNKCGDF